MDESSSLSRYDFLKVLYVEDEELTRESMQRILRRQTPSLTLACNGLEGLEAFKRLLPDVVISDINMPEMNGLEMAKAIKMLSPSTPIIITTAHSDADHLISAINIGIDYFLTKPIESKKLRELIEKIARSHLQRLEAERAHKLLHEYKKAVDASAILTISDTGGNIIYANDKVVEISGYSREELLGSPHRIFRHPDVAPSVFEEMWRTIQSKQIWKGLIKNKNRQGEAYYVDSTIVPVLDENDTIIEYLGLRYDVTQRVQSESALREAMEKAKSADAAKSAFLANMSHEIRTPMNGILGFVELLKESPLSQEQQEHVEIVYSSAQHLLEIINDILDLSKIESGQLRLEQIPFDFRPELERAIMLFQARAQEKNIELVCTFDESLPQTLIGDPVRIRQVLSNLTGNAIKFTDPGGKVHVALRKEGDSEEGVRVNFEVRDSGIGIPTEKQESIFHPFEQADASVTRKYGGTGLGLSISRQLVSQMGGALELHSAPGIGSRFFFTLKMPLGEARTPTAATAPEGTYFKGKILVAEDHPVNQKLIKLLLEGFGLEVFLVPDGMEAVELWQKEWFDLIFMDINMPVMDGLQATREIHQRSQKGNRAAPPVIALTANVLSGDKERFIEAGMQDCLPKPIQKTLLFSMLKKYLTSSTPPLPQESKVSLEGAYAQIRATLGLDDETIQSLLQAFAEDTPMALEQLFEGVRQKDLETLRKQAHYIKGSAANLHLEKIAKVAKAIEQAAQNAEDVDYGAMASVLKGAFEQFMHALGESG